MIASHRHTWDDETDVVVVGLGGAGACAAIEACAQGARVLVLERFMGGGATAMSGGVVYAGGGTDIQAEAGVDDDVQAMHNYLSHEVSGVISEDTLRDFCERSVENLRWLAGYGLQFEGSLCPEKTSYPNDQYFLYYSGNELAEPSRKLARPAPRGHRVKGKGLPGRNFFDPLEREVFRLGAEVRTQSRARELITDESGRVIGVAYARIPPGIWAGFHRRIETLANSVALYQPWLARGLRRIGGFIEKHQAKPHRVHAKRGVILSSGGFMNNPKMVEEYAPAYRSGLPIGTTGCSGDGIQMGQAVGARLEHMQRISAWFFLNPPKAFMHGMLINQQGKRFVNEALYGAVVGEALIEQSEGAAFLIIDSELKAQARTQLGRGKTQTFQRVPALINLLMNCRRADTVRALAKICGCEATVLEQTLQQYNEATRTSAADALGKDDRAVLQPPFYAMDCSAGRATWPIMMLTLGGLSVNETTGAVLGADGTSIPGLYAAGRAAVGVCSRQYVSGLSIADCVYSGRRAGRNAAGPAW